MRICFKGFPNSFFVSKLFLPLEPFSVIWDGFNFVYDILLVFKNYEDGDYPIHDEWDNVNYVYNKKHIFRESFDDSNWVFLASDDFRIIECALTNTESSALPNNTFMHLLINVCRYYLILNNCVLAHASMIETRSQAILFCGLPGAGKSTQANMWKLFMNARVINYDKPLVMNENGEWFACGSPWSGKEPCYINEKYPLGALVFIIKDNETTVKKISPVEAYSRLYMNFMAYPINNEVTDVYERVICEISINIPTFELHSSLCMKDTLFLEKEIFHFEHFEYIEERKIPYMKIKPNFALRNIADEWIVIPRGSSAINFSATVLLNDVGAFIWRVLENGATFDEIIEKIMEEYDVEKATASSDLLAFIDKMKNVDVIDI